MKFLDDDLFYMGQNMECMGISKQHMCYDMGNGYGAYGYWGLAVRQDNGIQCKKRHTVFKIGIQSSNLDVIC